MNILNKIEFTGKITRTIFDANKNIKNVEKYSNIRTNNAFEIIRDIFYGDEILKFWNSESSENNPNGFNMSFNIESPESFTLENAFDLVSVLAPAKTSWNDTYDSQGIVTFKKADESKFLLDGIYLDSYLAGDLEITLLNEGRVVLQRMPSYGDSNITFSNVVCDRMILKCNSINIKQIRPYYFQRIGTVNIGTGLEPIQHETLNIETLASLLFESSVPSGNVINFKYFYANQSENNITVTRAGLSNYDPVISERKLFSILETNTILAPNETFLDTYELTISSNFDDDIMAQQLSIGRYRFNRIELKNLGVSVLKDDIYLNEIRHHEMAYIKRLRNIQADTLIIQDNNEEQQLLSVSITINAGNDPEYIKGSIKWGGSEADQIVYPDTPTTNIDDISNNILRLEKDNLITPDSKYKNIYGNSLSTIYFWEDISGNNNHARESNFYKDSYLDHSPRMTRDKELMFQQFVPTSTIPAGLTVKGLKMADSINNAFEGSNKNFTIFTVMNRKLNSGVNFSRQPLFSKGNNLTNGNSNLYIDNDRSAVRIENNQITSPSFLRSDRRSFQSFVLDDLNPSNYFNEIEWYKNDSFMLSFDSSQTTRNSIFSYQKNGVNAVYDTEDEALSPVIDANDAQLAIGGSLNSMGSFAWAGSPDTTGVVNAFNGVINAIIAFDRKLTDQEIEQVNLYIEEKYLVPYARYYNISENYIAEPSTVSYRQIKDIVNKTILGVGTPINSDIVVRLPNDEVILPDEKRLLIEETPTSTGQINKSIDLTTLYGRNFRFETELIEMLKESFGDISVSPVITSKYYSKMFDIAPLNGFFYFENSNLTSIPFEFPNQKPTLNSESSRNPIDFIPNIIMNNNVDSLTVIQPDLPSIQRNILLSVETEQEDQTFDDILTDSTISVTNKQINIESSSGFEAGKTYRVQMRGNIRDIYNTLPIDLYPLTPSDEQIGFIFDKYFTIAIDNNINSLSPLKDELVSNFENGNILFSYPISDMNEISIEKKWTVPTDGCILYASFNGSLENYFGGNLSVGSNTDLSVPTQGGYRKGAIFTNGGNDSWIVIPGGEYIDSSNQNDFTICAWVRMLSGSGNIFSLQNSFQDASPYLILSASGTNLIISLSGSDTIVDLSSHNIELFQNWNSFTIKAHDDNFIDILINGIEIFSQSSTIRIWSFGIFGFGGNSIQDPNNARIVLDELYKYNRALSELEITQWVNETFEGSEIREDDLLNRWDLNNNLSDSVGSSDFIATGGSFIEFSGETYYDCSSSNYISASIPQQSVYTIAFDFVMLSAGTMFSTSNSPNSSSPHLLMTSYASGSQAQVRCYISGTTITLINVEYNQKYRMTISQSPTEVKFYLDQDLIATYTLVRMNSWSVLYLGTGFIYQQLANIYFGGPVLFYNLNLTPQQIGSGISPFLPLPTTKELDSKTQFTTAKRINVKAFQVLNNGQYRYKIPSGFSFTDLYQYNQDFVSNFTVGFTVNSIIPAMDSKGTEVVNQILITFQNLIKESTLTAIKLFRVENNNLREVAITPTLSNPTASTSLITSETSYTLGAGLWRIIISTDLETIDGENLQQEYVSDFNIDNEYVNYYMDSQDIAFGNNEIEFWATGSKF